MAVYQNRLQEAENILSEKVIDIKKLRSLSFSGCPHEKSIRSKAWKVLLEYLPLETSDWDKTLDQQRRQYADFINEMVIQPGSKKYDVNRCDVTTEDHPLNPNPKGQWSQYFKDNDTLLQIDKDCRRLYPGLGYFQKATDHPCIALTQPKDGIETLRRRVEKYVLKAQNISKTRLGVTIADYKRGRSRSAADEFVVLSEGEEAHWEVAERILFIYSKLNPGQGYVQGMNEILGPIYFTFSSDTDPAWQVHAEADAFWCFTNLMSEIRDNFIKAFDDDNQSGTGMLMSSFQNMLKLRDTTLWCKLQEQELRPQFYAFRWLTLLLSQEFPLPVVPMFISTFTVKREIKLDVLRLWDSLFADEHRFNFLITVACGMLILAREDLLHGDFPHNMKLLQNYPGERLDGRVDIVKVISKGIELDQIKR